jgi:hypothetical protein
MKEEVYVWCHYGNVEFFRFGSNIDGLLQEEFEDTKRVIKIRISKKNKQRKGQENSTKGQKKIYKTHIKLKIE